MNPPHSLEAEASVLGSILISAKAYAPIALDVRLKAEHFYLPKHARIYTVIGELADKDEPIDSLTVSAVLPDLRDLVHQLPHLVPVLANWRHYAEIVREKAELRQKLDYARSLSEAAYAEDWTQVRKVEAQLLEGPQERLQTLTPALLAERLRARVESKEIQAFPLPWRRLNELTRGGLQAGHVTLLGGWSGHGKSATAGMIATCASRYGAEVRYYLTADMTAEEAGLRLIALKTSIPLGRLTVGDIRPEEEAEFETALTSLPFSFVEAYDWTAQEIAHDCRRHKPDLAIVDILHEMEYSDERDLAGISRTFNTLARQTGIHLLATVHLNDFRATSERLPPPAARDIKGASALRQGANNVLFVWRENNVDRIEPEGRLYFSKVRGGETGGIDVSFDGDAMRFSSS